MFFVYFFRVFSRVFFFLKLILKQIWWSMFIPVHSPKKVPSRLADLQLLQPNGKFCILHHCFERIFRKSTLVQKDDPRCSMCGLFTIHLCIQFFASYTQRHVIFIIGIFVHTVALQILKLQKCDPVNTKEVTCLCICGVVNTQR